MSTTNGETPRLRAGVIGVGHMGRHHARVYSETPEVELIGVHDESTTRAESVATEHGTNVLALETLLAEVDLVSVAVPTPFHYETVRQCLDAGVHVLVEKPFVEDHDKGRELVTRARESELVLQVGHIERFNPATRVLADVVPDLDVVAIDIERLGPPLDRENEDSVVMDLMVHDIDILLSLVDSDLQSLGGTAHSDRHATAQCQFDDGCVASLTASRLTQQKVRSLSVTAQSCRVNADFIDQSVEIHRRSLPEYVESDGDIRYRHESVVERPMVESGEPLRGEIDAFVAAVRAGEEPVVTPADALRVLEVAEEIESLALEEPPEVESV